MWSIFVEVSKGLLMRIHLKVSTNAGLPHPSRPLRRVGTLPITRSPDSSVPVEVPPTSPIISVMIASPTIVAVYTTLAVITVVVVIAPPVITIVIVGIIAAILIRVTVAIIVTVAVWSG